MSALGEWNPSISELTFSKAFLVLLQNTAVGVPSDATTVSGAPSPALLSKMPKVRSAVTQPPASGAAAGAAAGAAGLEDTVTVSVKSLRAPHKFAATVRAAATDSVFRLKAQLLAEPAVAATAGPARVGAGDVRLLKRGKVVSDAHSVGELAEAGELALVAVLPAEGTAPAAEARQEDKAVEQTEEEEDELSETVWEAVASVVASRVGSAKASEIVARLKRGWVLAGSGEAFPAAHADLD